MSNFMNAVKSTLSDEFNYSTTENGALGYRTTGKDLLDLNFSVASLRRASPEDIAARFRKAFFEDKVASYVRGQYLPPVYFCTISWGYSVPALIFVSPFSSLDKNARRRTSSFRRNAALYTRFAREGTASYAISPQAFLDIFFSTISSFARRAEIALR